MAKRLTKNAFAFIKSYLIYEPLLAIVELFSPRRDPRGRSPIPFAVGGQPSSLLLDPMQSARQLLNVKGHLDCYVEVQRGSWKTVPGVRVISVVLHGWQWEWNHVGYWSLDPGRHHRGGQCRYGHPQVLQVDDRHQFDLPNVECDLELYHNTPGWCQDAPLCNHLHRKYQVEFVEGNVNPALMSNGY